MPYHKLEVYKKAYQLALDVHKQTLSFPKFEQFELGSQLRRSSKSIVANIAEGMGKQESKADVRHFLKVALGSTDESRVWIEFARDLGYWDTEEHDGFEDRFQEIGRMLQGVIKRYE